MMYVKTMRFNASLPPNVYNSTEWTPPLTGIKEQLDAVKKYGGVEKGYETLETYNWAANECKNITDPEDDK